MLPLLFSFPLKMHYQDFGGAETPKNGIEIFLRNGRKIRVRCSVGVFVLRLEPNNGQARPLVASGSLLGTAEIFRSGEGTGKMPHAQRRRIFSPVAARADSSGGS